MIIPLLLHCIHTWHCVSKAPVICIRNMPHNNGHKLSNTLDVCYWLTCWLKLTRSRLDRGPYCHSLVNDFEGAFTTTCSMWDCWTFVHASLFAFMSSIHQSTASLTQTSVDTTNTEPLIVSDRITGQPRSKVKVTKHNFIQNKMYYQCAHV